ncbi:MAG: hypothetical protein IPO08_07765 [Xanthomonadales bacterium]|jgi:hypothetical protein|nr:hypothetical protein [Xanthomonadales bacterium]
MRRFLWTLLLACGLSLSAHADTLAAPESPVLALDRAAGEAPMLIVGELHGTQETPALVVELARTWADRGAVQVGLEIPAQEQSRLDAFLRSTGVDADRQALLAGEFWQTPRERSDGRRSEAMLALLESLRSARAAGARINVVAFDDAAFHGPAQDRNARMAERLRLAHEAQPQTRTIVLTGNYHARRNAPAGVTRQSVPEGYVPPQPMTAHLREIGARTVNVSGRETRFWACLRDQPCGPQRLPVQSSVVAPLLASLDGPDRDYDAVLTLPVLHVSEPVTPDADR